MREWLKASKGIEEEGGRATRGRKGLGEEVAGVDSARSRHAISIFKKKKKEQRSKGGDGRER